MILNDSYATNNISLKNDKNAEILQLKKSLKDLNDSNPYQLDDYYQIPINDILFPLQIQTNNHNPINNIDFDEKSKTINIFINPLSSTNNKIDIGIPRSILDSKTIEGKDKNFNVTINNKPVKFLEINNTDKRHNYISNDEMKRTGNLTTNTDNRNLIIDFDKNSKIIRITGTNISTLKNIQQNGEKHTEEMIPINLKNQTEYLNLDIIGGQIIAAFLSHNTAQNLRNIELIIQSLFDKGKIDIGIPRSILDSKTIEGKDKNFNVTINNKPVKFLEINNTDKRHNYISNDEMKRTGNLTTNTDNRNLIIDFDKNSKIIRITGTNISTLKNIQQNGEKHTEESIKFIITIFSIICGIGIGLGYFISRKRKYSFVKKSQNK